jgi:hypothetical protein
LRAVSKLCGISISGYETRHPQSAKHISPFSFTHSHDMQDAAFTSTPKLTFSDSSDVTSKSDTTFRVMMALQRGRATRPAGRTIVAIRAVGFWRNSTVKHEVSPSKTRIDLGRKSSAATSSSDGSLPPTSSQRPLNKSSNARSIDSDKAVWHDSGSAF